MNLRLGIVRSSCCLTAVILLVIGEIASADTASLTPSKDNTLYESGSGSLSNGAGQFFFVGRTGGGLRRRGLAAFDIAGNIPAGSTINSVSLGMNLSTSSGGNPVITVELRRALADWGEGASDAGSPGGGGASAATGDATWLHTFFSSSFWGSAGGDFSGSASGSQTVSAIGAYTWGSSAGMVADVQDWLDNPASNFGWTLFGGEGSSNTAKRFDSRENGTPANRPTLEIDYTPPPPPAPVPTVSEWGLIVLTLLMLTAATMVFGRGAVGMERKGC